MLGTLPVPRVQGNRIQNLGDIRRWALDVPVPQAEGEGQQPNNQPGDPPEQEIERDADYVKRFMRRTFDSVVSAVAMPLLVVGVGKVLYCLASHCSPVRSLLGICPTVSSLGLPRTGFVPLFLPSIYDTEYWESYVQLVWAESDPVWYV